MGDKVRDQISKADDGEEDEFEEIWDEFTDETEDDVIGLCISFLVTQALRKLFGGCLPDAERKDEGLHTNTESLYLAGTGLVAGYVIILTKQMDKATYGRFIPQIKNIFAMIFAWCTYFSIT